MMTILTRVFAVVCMLSLMAGCDAGRDGGTTKIGALLPLTGDNASYGVDCRKGMELALAEYNAKNKSKVILIAEDTRADPKTAVTAINKLISVDRVSAIAGDMFSNTTLAVAPIAQKSGVVLVTPTASLEDIVRVGDHIFSIYPSDRYEGELDAKQALRDGARSFAVYQQQLQVFDTMGDAFKTTVVASGATVAFYEVFAGGTKDFRSLVERQRRIHADAIYIAAYKAEAFSLIKQIREVNPKIRIYSQSTLYDPQTLSILAGAAEGIVFSAPYFTEHARSPVVDKFRSAYAEKYGSQPNVWAAYGYDVLTLVLRGLEQAAHSGKPLHTVIASASLDGVTGTTTFFPNRTANKTMQMFEIKAGAFKPYPGS